jgi:hypothetical protein
MNVYHYIAQNNPDAANDICKKFGYFQINSIDELANCLQNIVAQDGESALKDVMSLHPDKDVLIELFDKKKDEPTPVATYTIKKDEKLLNSVNSVRKVNSLTTIQGATGYIDTKVIAPQPSPAAATATATAATKVTKPKLAEEISYESAVAHDLLSQPLP